MAEDRKQSLNIRQSKGNNTAIPNGSPITLHRHILTTDVLKMHNNETTGLEKKKIGKQKKSKH